MTETNEPMEGAMDNDGRPMDEFEWEEFLKKSDAAAAKYTALLDKYKDDPDCDAIIDREMGWDKKDEIERPWLEEFEQAMEEAAEDERSEEWKKAAGLERDDLSDAMEQDPLYVMGLAFAVDTIRWCNALPERVKQDPDMAEAMQHLLIPAAKIGGATAIHDEDEDAESLGLRIASYKRGLAAANTALERMSAVQTKGLIPSDEIFPFIRRATELRNALAMRVVEVRERFNGRDDNPA